jgi:hypothetical protein
LLQEQNQQLEQQYEEYMQLNEQLRVTNYDLEIEKERAEENDKLKNINTDLEKLVIIFIINNIYINKYFEKRLMRKNYSYKFIALMNCIFKNK